MSDLEPEGEADHLGRRSASPAISTLRRYVTDFVNRHDFPASQEFMVEDYKLESSGVTIEGRDGDYLSAVRRQLDQFPGLVFTPHEVVHSGDRIGIRFSEHGASMRHGDRCATWCSIAIYVIRDSRMVRCSIEQDYFGRRRQLATGLHDSVDNPAIAPWDTIETAPNIGAEDLVRGWLRCCAFQDDQTIIFDDMRSTGIRERVVEGGRVELIDIMSGSDRVVFRAVHHGQLVNDFCPELDVQSGRPVSLHLSGLVVVKNDKIVGGHIVRDRWGLYKQLARKA